MLRNFYRVLVAVVAIGVIGAFFYKTAPPAWPVADVAEFGGVSLRIEYATTPEDRERGLGSRTEIPEDYGMLFVFSKDAKHGFWMKDMLVPIDIFWLNDKGHVVYIVSSVATSTYPNVFYPNVPARYVLETASGFAKSNDIKIGTKLVLKNLTTVSQ